MKRLITILLFISFVLLQLQDFTPYLVYQLNKGYIANVLCINKSRPQLKCNGKCHLKQMLKKQASKQEEPSSPMQHIERMTINWLIQPCFSFNFNHPHLFEELVIPYFLKQDQFLLDDIFRPPTIG